jgi:hypothetical protein
VKEKIMRKRAVLAVLLSFVALSLAAPTVMASASVSGVTRASAPAATAAARALAARDLTAPITPLRVTSSFDTFTKHDYQGTPHITDGCGGHNLPLPIGSYKWNARGQTGRMYNCKNERCSPAFSLPSNEDAHSTLGVGWKSIFIVC